MSNALSGLQPRERLLLLIAAIFGLAYLVDDFGLAAPYPGNVIIKTTGIALLAVLAVTRKRPLLAVGLAAGACGDALLDLQPPQVTAGIAAFGVGHLIYVALFVGELRREGSRGLPGWIGAGVLACFGVAMLIYLQPHFGELRGPASVYNGIIIVMACLATAGRSPTPAMVGALLFVASDSVLAMRMFAGQLPWAGPLVWLTYFLGQAGIALGLSRPRTPDGEQKREGSS